MSKSILDSTDSVFEQIKHINQYGAEVWYARDLAEVLNYTKWANFKRVIEKAMIVCESSDNEVLEHFADVGKMIKLANGATREIDDFALSRYACYLIIQEADSRKEVVALGKNYFTIQTRKQELQEKFAQLTEDQRRIAVRDELKIHNKQLAEAAKDAGVEAGLDYAIFQNFGYMGLYGGLKAKDIHKNKGLKKSQKILDHMSSTELAANLFRATQTEEKLRRDNVHGKDNANQTHYQVGKKVRSTIQELGGTMPEKLPTPEKSIQKLGKKDKQPIDTSKDNTTS